MTIVYIVSIWTAVSIPCGIGFCWLIKTKRISFEPAEDELAQFSHHWVERRP